jgi:hypothetical protein
MLNTASLERAVIFAKSPELIRSAETIHEPPQARILSNARYFVMLPALIPPVGMNLSLWYGAEIALMYSSPPACSAGKNFTTSSPASIACSTSEGEEQPGVMGIPFLTQ